MTRWWWFRACNNPSSHSSENGGLSGVVNGGGAFAGRSCINCKFLYFQKVSIHFSFNEDIYSRLRKNTNDRKVTTQNLLWIFSDTLDYSNVRTYSLYWTCIKLTIVYLTGPNSIYLKPLKPFHTLWNLLMSIKITYNTPGISLNYSKTPWYS